MGVGGGGGHRIGWAPVLEQNELRRYPHPRPTSSPPPPPLPSHLWRRGRRCSVRPSGSCPGCEWAVHIEWYVSMEMDCPEVIRFYRGHGFCHNFFAWSLGRRVRAVLKEPNFFLLFLLRTAPRDHQPPTTNLHQPPTAANRQRRPTANRQSPPTTFEHMSCTRSFCTMGCSVLGRGAEPPQFWVLLIWLEPGISHVTWVHYDATMCLPCIVCSILPVLHFLRFDLCVL